MATLTFTVAEMQGLYGPFTIAERVVQKIWLQLDFTAAQARLTDGRRLEVLHPGRWNLLGGPDFRRAKLRVDGRELVGDVEVHFHAADWRAHGHAGNPAYRDVVLHVLLFPSPPGEAESRLADGSTIPALVLLPLLHRDLEEYAADDALESLTAQDEARRVAELLNRPVERVRELLRLRARQRWEGKVHHARQRLARLGWEEAAHHTALEILGYRHNRVPMLTVAERWPLAMWRAGQPAAESFAALGDRWQRHGIRPANRPERRLAQYQDWCNEAGDWPRRLQSWLAQFDTPTGLDAEDTSAFRRRLHLSVQRDRVWQEVLGRAVTAARFHTLVCDGFLPLAAAASGRDLAGMWFHWFAGDLPAQVRRVLGGLGVIGAPEHPWCNGWAQGLLAWLIEKETHT